MINKIAKDFIKKILPQTFILLFWHYPRAVLAVLLYNFPAKKLIVIGVAGTKGKTTTCHLISRVIEGAGKKVAMISTATLKIGQKEGLNSFKMTTLPPFFLQKFVKEALKVNCQYLILETSSHALIQHRTLGIPFKIVVLTNLMSDHLDYHKTARAYQKCHQKMITPHLQFLILNGDDPNLEEFLKLPLLSGQKIIYGIKDKKDVLAKDIVVSPQGSSFIVESGGRSQKINLSLLGKFNISNALAAIACALSQKINLETIKKGFLQIREIPGRLEKIDCGQDFKVIVDYAHSPDSLSNLFGAITGLKQGRIIVVFGACGERDASPRPKMGEIIDRNSDYVIVTNDDPYGENPEKIAQDLISGIKNKTFGQNFWKILDRKSAIQKAVSLARKDDLVLILGKGSEQWQIFRDKKIPWDDRKVIQEILRQQYLKPCSKPGSEH